MRIHSVLGLAILCAVKFDLSNIRSKSANRRYLRESEVFGFLFHWNLLKVFVDYEISKSKANQRYLRESEVFGKGLRQKSGKRGEVPRVVFCPIHTPPNQIGEQKHGKKFKSIVKWKSWEWF